MSYVEIIGKCLSLIDYPLTLQEKIVEALSLLKETFSLISLQIFQFENGKLHEIYSIGKCVSPTQEIFNRILVRGEFFRDNNMFYFPVKDDYFIYGILIIELKHEIKDEEIKFISIFCRVLSLIFKEELKERKIKEKLLKSSTQNIKILKEFSEFSYTEDDKRLLLKLFSLHERVKIFKVFFSYLKFSLNIKKAIYFKKDTHFRVQYAITEDDLNFVSLNDAFLNFDRLSFNKIEFNKRMKKIGSFNLKTENFPYCDLKLSKVLLKDFKMISMFPVKLKSINLGLLVVDGIDDINKLNKISVLSDILAGILNYSKKFNNLKLFYKKLEIQEKSSFFEILGEISHEIKNPIMAISGFSNRLVKNFEKMDKEKIRKYLNIISHESHRLERLLKDLLIFSKTDKISINPVDIIEIINETIELIENELNRRNIKIFFEYKIKPKIFGNKLLLKQVILNIITNSIEAIEKDGKIFIKIQPKEKMCVIIFEDTGGGIPEEIINKIFEPFFSTKDFGTGLGLTVSYRIIQQHGGDIKIKNIENGTRIEIFIPCRR